MGKPLDKISISGFKSIRSLEKLSLGNLNILIGANGAGKSNFVDFFRMLRAMAERGLNAFATKMGGADGFFFGGPKETPQISATLEFDPIPYRFVLEPTAGNEFIFSDESTFHSGKGWRSRGSGYTESRLRHWEGGYVLNMRLTGCMAYHFNDTGMLAFLRREHSVHNGRELSDDAGNLAAFLWHLDNERNDKFILNRIRETIQLVAPYFDDFLFEPRKKGEDEKIRLQWRQKGSSYPFQPWHLSDGTIRFIALSTALLQPHPPTVMIFDEPELGLHPFALEVLANLISEAADRTQIIVSTQSVQLLNHFQPEDVIVVDRVKGASEFRRLDPALLKEWLKDYSLGELWQKNVLSGGPTHE